MTMPVFTIKAQDALAPEVVAHYRNACTVRGLHEQAAQVQLAYDEILAWQAANPDRVKMPDHDHVSSGVGIGEPRMPELHCLVCLYVRPRPDLSEDDRPELELLTVVNGQMVCLRHVGCARSTYHDTLKSGVHLESRGEMTSLSEYQDWRYAQDAGRTT